ncbi:ATP-dependent RNA helicase HrpA [Opitutus sp. GAS368]|jgi:ATP-dependent helicase HrpA|uniref:ATP-dependent RNA helicase HrpA n=1 Tax=Opitutus sp. GAS368 TaxID=1882749 RepID=UPI00087BA9D9|nr:ATP-dependent RNA helicase HrpA [Opitutus sp. GAS368]SDR84085.1 ATP-dependent helicase HrpA [Opitutus sp. GAS368]
MPPRPKKPWPFRIEYPPELPISARADEIIAAIRDHQVLVLAGETGSGKTTQIPKMCLVAGRGEKGRIACTQPRRVAATSVARRVAEELNVPLGREVGCKIRFADQTSDDTVIKFMTDGMLLAELQADPELRAYDTIIVDEAHERSLNIDFILGHLRRLRVRRPDLKIIITSATIDTEAFSKAFDGAPIIEVSGRVYPVEVIYSPLEEMGRANLPDEPPGKAARRDDSPYQKKSRPDDFTYIDAAVEAVERVLLESSAGDVLVFMPTERDIRETRDLLEGRRLGRIEVVPLFGRLTNAEQQRVFASTQGRKVIVATNIAETSLTIPGIRFVIDTGLSRFSRYTPQSRTRRLPVEPVSQSSADQRKGRCGRVSDGVCIRLYSEQDFNDRPRFTQPEIQRSNLADVILRMKAFGLGDIEEFPFLNAPPAKGIRAGYALLHELGAIDDAGVLTDLGRELAHLPVDPTVGRMILQARNEKALREVLIIAAALSIQDPRERPLDQQQKADTAHKRFTHPDSDFLTLLAIWEIYHDEFEAMTLGKQRKFCTAHFLSFMRMREWRDVHAQLEDTLRERDGFTRTSIYDGVKQGQEVKLALGTPAFAAIHRSILAGLLGNIATRTDEGDYHAAHDRRVNVFPGSALFEKTERKHNPSGGRVPPPKAKVARWLMAAEIMETARIYARTCARIDPHWVLDLGAHLLRVAHSEPFWNAEAGRVLVKERRRLYNLELETRSASYGRINPAHATEIFIREGLVGDTVTWPFDFLVHNRRIRDEAETRLTRTRSSGYMNLDEAVYRFYAREFAKVEPGLRTGLQESGNGENLSGGRVPPQGISSVPELIDFVRHQQATRPKFLFMAEDSLRSDEEVAHDATAFPEAMPVDNRVLPLAYAYQPGKEADGVTVRVSLAEAEALTAAALDWAVPGHLPEKVELMLKALPKEQRRNLIPLTETAQKLVRDLALISARPKQPTLAEALAELLSPRLGVRIDPALWDAKIFPDHLRVRVEVVDNRDQVLGASRDLAEIQAQLHSRSRDVSKQAATVDNSAWRAARAKWEGEPAAEWKFGDLPEKILVSEHHGVPVHAHPGLKALPAGVAVRLFATPEEATAASRAGLVKLFETQLRHDLGWLEKDLKALRMLGTLAVTLTTPDALQADAFESIRRWVCDAGRMGRANRPDEPKGTARRDDSPYQLTKAAFEQAIIRAKQDLRGLVPKLGDWLKEIFTLRLALQTAKQTYPGMADDLAALLPPDFLRTTPFERIAHLPRYLKGLQARAERARRDPAKDAARAAELAPFVKAVAALYERRSGGHRPPLQGKAGEFRWLVEEFRVSLFAQELGTVEPVSAVRLERMLAEVGGANPPDEPARRDDSPYLKPATATSKKGAPLKSLGALDQLFRK